MEETGLEHHWTLKDHTEAFTQATTAYRARLVACLEEVTRAHHRQYVRRAEALRHAAGGRAQAEVQMIRLETLRRRLHAALEHTDWAVT